jgi:hypothetical protein
LGGIHEILGIGIMLDDFGELDNTITRGNEACGADAPSSV